jgi:hypothetical protein
MGSIRDYRSGGDGRVGGDAMSKTNGYGAKVLEGDPEAPSYLETPEFEQFTEKVAKAFAKRKTPPTIGDIYRRIGRDKMHWLADALEALKVEEIGVLPTRYKLVTHEAKDLFADIRTFQI